MADSDKGSHYRVSPGGSVSGEITVPGDKSISHRALMLGALAEGETEITGFLTGEDCLSTLRALRALGVSIECPEPEHVRVRGVGVEGLRGASSPLEMGNAGTAMRPLAAALAVLGGDYELSGVARMHERPIGDLVDALRQPGWHVG